MLRPLSVVIALALSGACISQAPPGDQGLSDRIADLAQRVPDTTVNLATLAPFHWTRLYIFQPYTSKEAAERVLGFEWPYEWGAIEGRDDRALLVFVDSGRVVAAFEQTKDRGNFAQAAGGVSYPRDSATFRLVTQDTLSNGAPNVVARWQP
jgi:hypothetical protein